MISLDCDAVVEAVDEESMEKGGAVSGAVSLDPEEIRCSVDGLWAIYPDPTGRVINVLNDIQERYRHLPEAACKRVAELADVPVSRIKQMGEFFSYLSLDPVGFYMIDVCDGTACHAAGSVDLLREFERMLGIKAGQTTEDGLITLRTVGCVGACGMAPVVVADKNAYGHVRITKVKDLADTVVSRAHAEGGAPRENGAR